MGSFDDFVSSWYVTFALRYYGFFLKLEKSCDPALVTVQISNMWNQILKTQDAQCYNQTWCNDIWEHAILV